MWSVVHNTDTTTHRNSHYSNSLTDHIQKRFHYFFSRSCWGTDGHISIVTLLFSAENKPTSWSESLYVKTSSTLRLIQPSDFHKDICSLCLMAFAQISTRLFNLTKGYHSSNRKQHETVHHKQKRFSLKISVHTLPHRQDSTHNQYANVGASRT